MRHYFGERGWPSSKVHGGVASSEADFEDMVDQLQVCSLTCSLLLRRHAGLVADVAAWRSTQLPEQS